MAYDTRGVPLDFGDDLTLGAGGLWLPTPLLFEAGSNGGFSVRAPALVTEFVTPGTPDDLTGTHYCKLLSHQQALYWLRQRAFDPEPAWSASISSEPLVTSEVEASCVFYFAPAEQYFCEEYWGSVWDPLAAEEKCVTRDGIFAPAMCEQRADEIASYDSEALYQGACVLQCGTSEERRWLSYSNEAASAAEFCVDWFGAQ